MMIAATPDLYAALVGIMYEIDMGRAAVSNAVAYRARLAITKATTLIPTETKLEE